MKTFKQIYLLLFLGTVFFSACSSENEEVDLRNQVVGEYIYTKTVYHNLGIDTETGTLFINSDDTDIEKLILTEEETFFGSTLNAVDSSLIFYIPQQDIKTEQGDFFSIVGVSNVNIGDYRGDAGYFPKENQLKLYYKVEFEEQPKLNYMVSVLAEKKKD